MSQLFRPHWLRPLVWPLIGLLLCYAIAVDQGALPETQAVFFAGLVTEFINHVFGPSREDSA